MKALKSSAVEFSCSLGSSSRGAGGVGAAGEGAAAWICECTFRITAAPITSTSSVWNPQPVMGHVFVFFLLGLMSHILRTSTEHKTASLADEGNSAYCQSSGAANFFSYTVVIIVSRSHYQY